MSKKILISLLVGSILLFGWNAISWMVLPFHTQSLKNIPAGIIDAKALQKAMPESGVYHFPGFPEDMEEGTMKKINARLQSEPRITMMNYVNRPTSLFDPLTFAFSFLLNFLTVLFTYWLLSNLKSPTFQTTLISCLAIGIISSILSDISLMNWFMFPLGYTLTMVFDKMIAFTLLGILFGTYTFKR